MTPQQLIEQAESLSTSLSDKSTKAEDFFSDENVSERLEIVLKALVANANKYLMDLYQGVERHGKLNSYHTKYREIIERVAAQYNIEIIRYWYDSRVYDGEPFGWRAEYKFINPEDYSGDNMFEFENSLMEAICEEIENIKHQYYMLCVE